MKLSTIYKMALLSESVLNEADEYVRDSAGRFSSHGSQSSQSDGGVAFLSRRIDRLESALDRARAMVSQHKDEGNAEALKVAREDVDDLTQDLMKAEGLLREKAAKALEGIENLSDSFNTGDWEDEDEEPASNMRYDYSGRGMMGKKCPGFTVDRDSFKKAMDKAEALADKHGLGKPDSDSMGRDFIIYFPGLDMSVLKES